jgi:integrase/recombinase XerD
MLYSVKCCDRLWRWVQKRPSQKYEAKMSALTKFIREIDVSIGVDRAEDWNRGQSSSIEAETDVEALTMWIRERSGKSESTRSNYIKEANRVLLWCKTQAKDLGSLTRDDVYRYKEFLEAPPEEYCGNKVSRNDEDWQPFFSQKPSINTVKQSIGVVCAMLGWLKMVGYLKVNPAEKIPVPRSTPEWRRRAIPDSALLCVRDYLDEMPVTTPLQKRRQARMRWLFHLMNYSGLRISEVRGTKMGNFVSETRNGKSRTFLEVTGKGGKKRAVPVISELMDELVIYRESLGLDAYPSEGEDTPLVCTIESGRPLEEMTRQAVHNAVKLLLEKTMQKLISIGCDQDAKILSKVSAHWFRHTYATRLLDSGASLRTGRDNLGHSSLNTTNMYSHSEQDDRFDETERLGAMLKDKY